MNIQILGEHNNSVHRIASNMEGVQRDPLVKNKRCCSSLWGYIWIVKRAGFRVILPGFKSWPYFLFRHAFFILYQPLFYIYKLGIIIVSTWHVWVKIKYTEGF